jgi:hypothetical protein
MIGWIFLHPFFPKLWLWSLPIFFYLFMKPMSVIISRLRFKEIGSLKIESDQIIANIGANRFVYKYDDLNKVRIYYAGDKFWKAKFKLFAKSKGKNRYNSMQWSSKAAELSVLDRIFIDTDEYQIKIRSSEEKSYLLKLRDLCEAKGISVEWEEYKPKPIFST